MKTFLVLSALLLVVGAGCKNLAPGPVTGERHSDHPQGTAIGASFPGVNQGTQTTTATASTDT
jgi:hypothetical protein